MADKEVYFFWQTRTLKVVSKPAVAPLSSKQPAPGQRLQVATTVPGTNQFHSIRFMKRGIQEKESHAII